MKQHTTSTAKAMIERNRGAVRGKNIKIASPGIKVLGAIDFLVNHRGFRWVTGR